MKKQAEVISQKALRMALILSGDIPPTTPEEVAMIEQFRGDGPELPAHLRDPLALLDEAKKRESEKGSYKLPIQNDLVLQESARAARNGRDISPEIEERMRNAREKALEEENSSDTAKR